MATIETAIRAMLTSHMGNATVADARITHGYRLQNSVLPAVTFVVDSTTSVTVDCLLNQSTVTVTGVAVTTLAANNLGADIIAGFAEGTYDTIEIYAPVRNSTTLDAPEVGDGDEQTPATITLTFDVYWSV